MNALLLSAGVGSRFRPTTDKIAKPAILFLNIPLMAYMLYYLEKAGLKNLVFNTHHLPQTVELAAKQLTRGQSYTVQFSHEPVLLGSGGGICQAKKFLCTDIHSDKYPDEYFVVANADEVFLFNHLEGLKPLIDFHKTRGALATLLTTEHPEAGKSMGGVWFNPSGEIFRLGGVHAEPGAKHFTGVFIFSRRIFSYMPAAGSEFHIFKDCLHKAMAAKEKVLAFHDPHLTWFDMSSEGAHAASTGRALKLLDSSIENSPTENIQARVLRLIFNRF